MTRIEAILSWVRTRYGVVPAGVFGGVIFGLSGSIVGIVASLCILGAVAALGYIIHRDPARISVLTVAILGGVIGAFAGVAKGGEIALPPIVSDSVRVVIFRILPTFGVILLQALLATFGGLALWMLFSAIAYTESLEYADSHAQPPLAWFRQSIPLSLLIAVLVSAVGSLLFYRIENRLKANAHRRLDNSYSDSSYILWCKLQMQARRRLYLSLQGIYAVAGTIVAMLIYFALKVTGVTFVPVLTTDIKKVAILGLIVGSSGGCVVARAVGKELVEAFRIRSLAKLEAEVELEAESNENVDTEST